MPKIIFLLFFSISCVCFSQNQKLIHGKVSYQDSYQKNVDVINFTTKKLTQTNTLGAFDIEAKVDDVIIFMSDSFADQKYTLTAKDFEKGELLVNLIEKPVPLDEVVIRQIKAIKIDATSYNGIKMAQLENQQSNPVNKDIYTGEIPLGMDFIQIGKMIGKLFKSKNPKPKTPEEKISFKEYAKVNFDDSFFFNTLELKKEQVPRFLDYCDADPQSKTVTEKDELAILEFLLTKKAGFKELK
jgi:transcription antitermination factor NusG